MKERPLKMKIKMMKYAQALLMLGLLLQLRMHADSMPEQVRQQLDKLVGVWDITLEFHDRIGKENATISWTEDQRVLRYEGHGMGFNSGKNSRFFGLFGWDDSVGLVREYGVTSQGGTFISDHRIKEDSWSDSVVSTRVEDGEVIVERFQRHFHFGSVDEWSLVADNRSVNDKSEPGFKVSFKRTEPREGFLAKRPSACQWEWMLGDWTVERSDGTNAHIQWSKPRKHVDYLIGQWRESNGIVSDEFISWQPDRGHLTVNNYRSDGSFSRIDFDRVERHSMRGVISKRDTLGKLETGVVMINRLSKNESRAKIILSDGSILEQRFRRAP